MSIPLFDTGGFRFWSEEEIGLREAFVSVASDRIIKELSTINGAWVFERLDAPLITPTYHLNDQYTGDDIWMLEAEVAEKKVALRPETTPSSYLYAQHVLKSTRKKLPLCVWQAGKSFRRETMDGASPSKLRFNEFYQLEFQCIFSLDTKVDYFDRMLHPVLQEIKLFTGANVRIVPSDRLPSYSEKTMDVEVFRPKNDMWTEMCSISLRTDYPEAKVFEIAIGLDRVVEVRNEIRGEI